MFAQILRRKNIHLPRFDRVEILMVATGILLATVIIMTF
jgi:hypothetical protein